MDMSPQAYQQYVKLRAPRSPLLKDAALAFAVGGAICVAGAADPETAGWPLRVSAEQAAGHRRLLLRWCSSPLC